MPIPAWTIGLVFKGIGAMIRHRREKKARKAALAALSKEVPQMAGIGQVLGFVLQLKFLEGYRAKIGGVGLLLGGAAGLLCEYTGTCDTGLDKARSAEMLALGMGILGIRGAVKP